MYSLFFHVSDDHVLYKSSPEYHNINRISFGENQITTGDFALGVHAKEYHHYFIAANIAAIILSRSVCSDP